jgi:hypothetical protein
MPVRKLSKSYGSLSGILPSSKFEGSIHFESSLERDFAYLLEHDASVDHYEVQPLKIEWTDQKGLSRKYTPDFLVFFNSAFQSTRKNKPQLIEIKYRDDLKKKWRELKPRFKAAVDFCTKRNWDFKIYTEREIHNDQLFNARFLQNFINVNYDFEKSVVIKQALERLKVSTPEEIIATCSNNKYLRAELLHTLWSLIAIGNIGYDRSEKLSMQSEIWCK